MNSPEGFGRGAQPSGGSRNAPRSAGNAFGSAGYAMGRDLAAGISDGTPRAGCVGVVGEGALLAIPNDAGGAKSVTPPRSRPVAGDMPLSSGSTGQAAVYSRSGDGAPQFSTQFSSPVRPVGVSPAHLTASAGSRSERGAATGGSVSPAPSVRYGAGSGGPLLMATLRKELDQMEARLLGEIRCVRDIAAPAADLEKAEKLREVAQARMEKKVLDHEGAMSKMDRKYSELSGAVRGLKDEAQQQIRKSESTDTRLWETRHQLEEEFRQKISDLETSQQELLSKCRLMADAAAEPQRRLGQRLKQVEGACQSLFSQTELTGRHLESLQERIEVVEVAGRHQESDKAPRGIDMPLATPKEDSTMDARVWDLEQRIFELTTRFSQQDTESLASKLQEHEIGLQGVKSKLDIHDEHYASFDERIRQDWEARFNKMQQAIQDVRAKHQGLDERHEALVRFAQDWRGSQEMGDEDDFQQPEPSRVQETRQVQLKDEGSLNSLSDGRAGHYLPNVLDQSGVKRNAAVRREDAPVLDDVARNEIAPKLRRCEQTLAKHEQQLGELAGEGQERRLLQTRLERLEYTAQGGSSPLSSERSALGTLSGRVTMVETCVKELESSSRAMKQDVDDLKSRSQISARTAELAPRRLEMQSPSRIAQGGGRGGGVDNLFQRVDESESECVRLQEQLQQRISTMDALLEKAEGRMLTDVIELRPVDSDSR